MKRELHWPLAAILISVSASVAPGQDGFDNHRQGLTAGEITQRTQFALS
jgi:hypothetical protein